MLKKMSDFSDTDIQSLVRMFDLAVKRKKAFARPEGWLDKMLTSDSVIAIKERDGRLLSSMLLLPVPGAVVKSATVQAALWRSPEAAVINWRELIDIARERFEEVFCAMYQDNQLANTLISSQPGVSRVSKDEVSLEAKQCLLFDPNRHYLYQWGSGGNICRSTESFLSSPVLSA